MTDTHKELQSMNEIPQILRFIMIFIDRVGFPILAFLMMSMVAYSGNQTIQKNTEAMIRFTTAFESFQKQVIEDHKRAIEAIYQVRDGIYYGKRLEGVSNK